MTKPRTPRTLAQATVLLEEFATLDAAAADIELARNEAIARANAEADASLAPILLRAEALFLALGPWWAAEGETLTKGKRKSMLIGGCKVGTAKERVTLDFIHDDEDGLSKDEAALQALQAHRWGRAYIHTKLSVHRANTLAGLDGRHGEKLKELGFAKAGGEDVFFVKRAEQGGTVA